MILKNLVNTISLLLCFSVIIPGCAVPYESEALKVIQSNKTNNAELNEFLDYCLHTKNKDKYKAACYLIANMPNKYSLDKNGTRIYDIDIVIADSLIRSLEFSFALLENSPFLKNCAFDTFCEYILPYRVAHEPLTYYWKWDCHKQYEHYTDSASSLETAARINENLFISIHADNYKNNVKSYTDLMNTGYGKCDDRAILLTMIYRSIGIPAAFEFIPIWGSSNNGHSFSSVILKNSSAIPFQDNDDRQFHRKVSKIYRSVYSIQKSDDKQPESIALDNCIDVTHCHDIGVRNVSVNKANAFCVFSNTGWKIVDYRTNRRFGSLGTGTDYANQICESLIDAGNGIIYLPARFDNGELYPVHDLLIVSDSSISTLEPDTSNLLSLTLTRKYPLSERMKSFADYMVGGIFEVSGSPDFSDAESVYAITDTPESRMQDLCIESSLPFRYVRYIKPSGVFSLAEFSVYNSDGQQINFKPICEEALSMTGEANKIFDNDILTYAEVNRGLDLWIGADLGDFYNSIQIGFAPRNDDNCISPGNIYELFYWDNDWISLGKQRATIYEIRYDNVPSNALLLLRNLSKGIEERPFLYINGKQIWY